MHPVRSTSHCATDLFALFNEIRTPARDTDDPRFHAEVTKSTLHLFAMFQHEVGPLRAQPGLPRV